MRTYLGDFVVSGEGVYGASLVQGRVVRVVIEAQVDLAQA